MSFNVELGLKTVTSDDISGVSDQSTGHFFPALLIHGFTPLPAPPNQETGTSGDFSISFLFEQRAFRRCPSALTTCLLPFGSDQYAGPRYSPRL